jgi:elongation factor G
MIASMAEIRNVVLVGHSGSGKTTLAEHLLHRCGATTRIGSVEDCTTVCDSDPIEHRVGHSVALSIATTQVSDREITGQSEPVQLTLLDTPGHADFVGELRAGLRGADAAVFVVSAVDGVHGSARVLWRECEAVGMPRAIAITHLDQATADWDETLGACQAAFGDGVHPLYLHRDDGALLDVVRRAVVTHGGARHPAQDGDLDAIDAVRGDLIEGVITESEDDALLEQYLAGEGVDFEALIDDLEAAVARSHFHPVLPVTPVTNSGIDELLEVICRGFPKPSEHVMPTLTTPDGEPRTAIEGRSDEPLVAEVIKTTTDAYVGRVSLVRIFAGTLRADTDVHVSGHFARFSGHEDHAAWHADHDVDEKAGALSTVFGSTLTPIQAASAGQIVAIARLTDAETGDTLSDPADPALMAPWTMPEPLLPTAIEAVSNKDEAKLADGLARAQAEDPTVRLVMDGGTHQMVLWTMGDQHRDVVLERLATRFGVGVSTAPVAVSLQCTVRGTGSATGRHVKQSGGHGQYAVCELEIAPLSPGSGVEFADKVVGGAVPRPFIASVEKGVRQQLADGVQGHPMVDVRVTLTGGKAHSVDSSDAAFQTAGAIAVQSAAAQAGIQLLEPVDVVKVSCEEEHVGAVLSDLAGRRARVRGTEPVGAGQTVVTAEVPAFELVHYAPQLRALAHGTGRFERQYLGHNPAPDQLAERLAETTS